MVDQNVYEWMVARGCVPKDKVDDYQMTDLSGRMTRYRDDGTIGTFTELVQRVVKATVAGEHFYFSEVGDANRMPAFLDIDAKVKSAEIVSSAILFKCQHYQVWIVLVRSLASQNAWCFLEDRR